MNLEECINEFIDNSVDKYFKENYLDYFIDEYDWESRFEEFLESEEGIKFLNDTLNPLPGDKSKTFNWCSKVWYCLDDFFFQLEELLGVKHD